MMQTLSLENGKYELRFDEASGALCAYRYGEPWQDFTGNKFIYLLMQAALAAAEAQPVGEPVAWGQLGTLNGRSYLRQAYDRTPYPPPAGVARELNLVPLYAAPPAQPAAQPLTDEQARDLVKECGLDWQRGYMPLFGSDPTNRYEVLIREVERRCSIGSQP